MTTDWLSMDSCHKAPCHRSKIVCHRSLWLSCPTMRSVNTVAASVAHQSVPNMAKAFEWNSDYTELTVTLRKGHKWSDGKPFTSDDIVFWWNDIVLNKDLYPDVPSYWIYGGEPMKVEKVDDVTVKFKFAAPSPHLPR